MADWEEALGKELAREVERYVILQTVDQRWREHLRRWTTCARARPPSRVFAQK